MLIRVVKIIRKAQVGEFSSNPNQTHLSMLIRVVKIIRKAQVGEFSSNPN